jgi:hypothetical protein
MELKLDWSRFVLDDSGDDGSNSRVRVCFLSTNSFDQLGRQPPAQSSRLRSVFCSLSSLLDLL